MTRSLSGIKEERTLSVVVFPEPVPPEIKMLSFASTQVLRKVAASSGNVPNEIRSSIVNGSAENLRIVRIAPSRAIGGTTAFTRLPSGNRASTSGLDSSIRRPT